MSWTFQYLNKSVILATAWMPPLHSLLLKSDGLDQVPMSWISSNSVCFQNHDKMWCCIFFFFNLYKVKLYMSMHIISKKYCSLTTAESVRERYWACKREGSIFAFSSNTRLIIQRNVWSGLLYYTGGTDFCDLYLHFHSDRHCQSFPRHLLLTLPVCVCRGACVYVWDKVHSCVCCQSVLQACSPRGCLSLCACVKKGIQDRELYCK